MKWILGSLCIILCLSANSAQESNAQAALCTDSLFVQVGPDNIPYLIWRTGGLTDIMSVLGTTGITPDDMVGLNPVLRFRELRPCDHLITVLQSKRIILEYSADHLAVWYRVRGGETLFGIAHRLLETSLDTLLNINDLKFDQVREGTVILLGWLPRKTHRLTSGMGMSTGVPWLFPDETLSGEMIPDTTGMIYSMETGVAWWNKSRRDPNLFALHRTAPIGSYVEIINPMFDRRVWAKVIGAIPPTYSKDIAVIVSEGVARELGAFDTRFYVEMHYATR